MSLLPKCICHRGSYCDPSYKGCLNRHVAPPSAPTSTAREEGAPAEPEEAGEVSEEKLTGEVRGDLIHELGYIPTANAFKIAKAVDREIKNATATLRADLSAARKRIAELSGKITDLTTEVVHANEDAETLKELAQGWEAQYHQAEGQIEYLQKQLSDKQKS